MACCTGLASARRSMRCGGNEKRQGNEVKLRHYRRAGLFRDGSGAGAAPYLPTGSSPIGCNDAAQSVHGPPVADGERGAGERRRRKCGRLVQRSGYRSRGCRPGAQRKASRRHRRRRPALGDQGPAVRRAERNRRGTRARAGAAARDRSHPSSLPKPARRPAGREGQCLGRRIPGDRQGAHGGGRLHAALSFDRCDLPRPLRFPGADRGRCRQAHHPDRRHGQECRGDHIAGQR
jgi:hypothetical protein